MPTPPRRIPSTALAPVPGKSLTPLQAHLSRWSRGCGGPCCQAARHVCLVRGTVPCDLLFVGEAPGACITGDSLIQVAYSDKSVYPNGVPVCDLVGRSGFQVYSYDLATKDLAFGTVKKVWCTGLRKVYRVSFFWWGAPPDGKGGRHKYYGSVVVTDNHPFLTKDGSYKSLATGLSVGARLQPFYRRPARYHSIGVSSVKLQKESRLLAAHKLGRPLAPNEQVHHIDRNKWNDSRDNLEVLDIAEHARLHGMVDNAMFDPKHRATHSKAMRTDEYRENHSRVMKNILANPEARARRSAQNRRVAYKTSATLKKRYEDPVFYYRYLQKHVCRNGIRFSDEEIRAKMAAKFPDVEYPPEDNHRVYKVEYVGIRTVYDMEVEGYHNFVANGVFVHNSEDVIGRPFVGPAGQLLDEICRRALDDVHLCLTCRREGRFAIAAVAINEEGNDVLSCPSGHQNPPTAALRLAFTNVVGCLPREETGEILAGGRPSVVKAVEPSTEDVMRCAPRVTELVEIARPHLIIAVGRIADEWLDQGARFSIPLPKGRGNKPIPQVKVDHPASILRANITMRNLMVQRVVAALRGGVEDLSSGEL